MDMNNRILNRIEIKKVIEAINIRLGGSLKYGLLVAGFSIVISWMILKIWSFIWGGDVSTSNVLLLTLIFMTPVVVSSNTGFLNQILISQQKQMNRVWDYRVYTVDENPTNVSPIIRISNASDVTELSALGFEISNNEGGSIQASSLERGMSMLSRIGWELVHVQRIGEFRYYYIFRRAGGDSILN